MESYLKLIRESIKSFFEEKETSHIEVRIAVIISCFNFLLIIFKEDKAVIINSTIAISTAIAAYSAIKALSIWKEEKSWDIKKTLMQSGTDIYRKQIFIREYLSRPDALSIDRQQVYEKINIFEKEQTEFMNSLYFATGFFKEKRFYEIYKELYDFNKHFMDCIKRGNDDPELQDDTQEIFNKKFKVDRPDYYYRKTEKLYHELFSFLRS